MQHASPNQPLVPAHVLSLQDYMKTAQGKALLAARRLFVYEGRLWGSSRGRLARVRHQQLDGGKIGPELLGSLDIDGTKPRLMALISARKDQQEREIRLEKALRQKKAAEQIEDLEKTAKVQEKEFGTIDPELTRTIGLARKALDPRAGEQEQAEQEPEPGSPEDLRRFVPHPDLHPELSSVPALDAEAADQNAQRFEERIGRMEDAVGKLTDLVLAQSNVPERTPGPPSEVATEAVEPAGPIGVIATHPSEEPAVDERPPAETCTKCTPPKSSPVGHFNPKMWLRGHTMSKHIPRKKRRDARKT